MNYNKLVQNKNVILQIDYYQFDYVHTQYIHQWILGTGYHSIQ